MIVARFSIKEYNENKYKPINKNVMSETKDGIIILSSGTNGSAVYDIFMEDGVTPVVTKDTLREVSKEIIRRYPDLAKGIKEHWSSSFASPLPKEINVKRLNHDHAADLIAEIAQLMMYTNK